MKYNTRSMRIDSIDWTQNENSKFHLKTGAEVSYKDYLNEFYGVASRSHERCVIYDNRGSAYLPQHMKLTMRSDECDDYGEVLQTVSAPIGDRLHSITEFVTHLNKTAEDPEERIRKRETTTSGSDAEHKEDDNSYV